MVVVGPLWGTENILNIQPVILIELNKDWNLITRLLQPFLNYNFPGGLYLTTSPIATANREATAASAGPCHWVVASAGSSTSASCP